MRTAIFIVIIISALTQLSAQSLDEFRWKNRIVLLSDPDQESDLLNEQINSFTPYGREIADRDMLIFIFVDSVVRDTQGNKLDIAVEEIPEPGFHGLILIGKDGGVKMKENFPVDPLEVFNLIDSMPMRRAEMRRSKKN